MVVRKVAGEGFHLAHGFVHLACTVGNRALEFRPERTRDGPIWVLRQGLVHLRGTIRVLFGNKREYGILMQRWPEYHVIGDPYYGPNIGHPVGYYRLRQEE